MPFSTMKARRLWGPGRRCGPSDERVGGVAWVMNMLRAVERRSGRPSSPRSCGGAGIGARAGLGEAEGADLLAGDQAGMYFFF